MNIRLKPPSAKRGEINYHLADRFTCVHFLIGCGYGWLELDFWLTLGLAIAWELIEDPLKANIPAMFPHGTADTWPNIIGDMLAVMLGWAVVCYMTHAT